ncbi:MAG TPA: DUF4229 domain-containing protein [Micromonosporaceae bacterium]
MAPSVKYTLARVGFFVVAVALLWPVPIDLLLKLMIAIVVSFVASFFLLRRWRDEMVNQIDSAVRRRRDEKERLRAALAGDDAPTGGDAATDADATERPVETTDDATRR